MSNKISRLTIKEDAWERKERSRLEEEEEKVAKEEVEKFKFKKSKSHSPPGALLPKPELTLHQAEHLTNPHSRSQLNTLANLTPGPLASRFGRMVSNHLMIEPGVAVDQPGQVKNYL